ncbi:hypothetical protein [Pontibacter akesuensis]|uniref:Quinol oxidase subunit 4 n=1 Tax=Pontibacter akesuensis TaxID=388950 RepID=A0A1I7G454_9BACT|nr:hypothetical protein [Pontibacter akesuensis]SFU43240.1 hypothetical protein SAMN04487941_0704 [Pontibacter akesuensis]
MAKKRQLFILSIALISASLFSCKPACPIGACQVRMVHPHGEGEYRGRPFWKKQNPKMGQDLDKTSKEKANRKSDKSRNKN